MDDHNQSDSLPLLSPSERSIDSPSLLALPSTGRFSPNKLSPLGGRVTSPMSATTKSSPDPSSSPSHQQQARQPGRLSSSAASSQSHRNPPLSTVMASTSPSVYSRSSPQTGHDSPESSGLNISPKPFLSPLKGRRSSHPVVAGPTHMSSPSHGGKVGPQRSTKITQKLKLLPNLTTEEEEGTPSDPDISSDVYSQIARIKEPSARRDAALLGKKDRAKLPRVSAYCTANSYALDSVTRFLKSRAKSRGASPKLFDECVYSPYNYDLNRNSPSQQSPGNGSDTLGDLIEFDTRPGLGRRFSDSQLEVDDHRIQQPAVQDTELGMDNPDETPVFDTTVHTPEVFVFDYGTVVIWGMTPLQETRFLTEISKFAETSLSATDMQVENFNFYYTRDYQARIYNDFISLRDPRNYMIKLAISHALAQSVKTSLFEDLVDESIETSAPLPAQIAETGSVNLTRRQINMQIGELFILRINIHLQGSVLDSPELMWTEPQLEPVYQAVRGYLEMNQRVELLTERLEVIADLLAVLKDQLSHRHGEYLEWIVIVLIAAEILVAAINIVVDVYAGD